MTCAAGEEITISYTSLEELRPDRRALLLDSYFFDIDPETPAEPPKPLAVHRLPTARAACLRVGEAVGGADVGDVVRVYEAPPSPLDPDRLQLTAVLGARLRPPPRCREAHHVHCDAQRS